MPTLNADDSELAKFGELAHRWWDPESEFKPLHMINPLRTAWINAATPLAGKTVLDIGCGGGILCESMARLGAQVSGIDLSEKPLSVARLHLHESNLDIRYRRVAAEELATTEAGQYDIVTCMEMLEHVPDPASIVRACATLTKAGGTVYFSTLNRNAKAYLLAVVGAEYVLNMLPRGTHDYQKFIKPSELSRFARDAGLHVQALTGLHYNPITQHYRLGEGTDVNYLMRCTRAA